MSSTCYRFHKGDVLYGRLRSYLNKVWLADFDGLCSSEFIVLPETEAVSGQFLRFRLTATDFIAFAEHQMQGDRPRADFGRLASFPLALPAKPLQRRIAGILGQADRLRRMRRYALELSDQFLPALFLRMFGDPVANPRGWRLKPLRALCEKFSDGPFGSDLKTGHYRKEGVRVIRLQNVGVGSFLAEDEAYIADDHFESLRQHECLAGDVIIGTLGDPNLRACILPRGIEPAMNKADCVQARINPSEATPEYVCWLMNMPETLTLAFDLVHGQTRSRVSMGQLAVLRVPTPPVDLQWRFSQMVGEYGRHHAVFREALRQAEHLFQSLLNQYFGEKN